MVFPSTPTAAVAGRLPEDTRSIAQETLPVLAANQPGIAASLQAISTVPGSRALVRNLAGDDLRSIVRDFNSRNLMRTPLLGQGTFRVLKKLLAKGRGVFEHRPLKRCPFQEI